MDDACDIAVVGAGAAGLMAAIAAGRLAHDSGRGLRIVALDGAVRLGAKILVAGGGRCNVMHDEADERAFCGSSPNAIKKVLRSFSVEKTLAFFASIGVDLVREPTGKLFPSTNSASTVLAALIDEAHRLGVVLRYPWRVAAIRRHPGPDGDDGAAAPDGFVLERDAASPRIAPSAPTGVSPAPSSDRLRARRVILATGGMSLPKTGSDGAGYALARALGHSITPAVFPALAPLVLGEDEIVRTLSGISGPATLEVRAPSGRVLARFTDSLLCTHFGLSGPAALDASRHWTAAALSAQAGTETGARAGMPELSINWLPAHTPATLEALLVSLASGGGARGAQAVSRALASIEFHVEREWLAGPHRLAERLARGVCEWSGVDPSTPLHDLTREARRRVARGACAMTPRVVGDRGFLFAEATAGGIPLEEVRLETMESRVCPGLHVGGEVCDVDGRIGGYNFQWAWSSGHAAGRGACRGVIGAA